MRAGLAVHVAEKPQGDQEQSGGEFHSENDAVSDVSGGSGREWLLVDRGRELVNARSAGRALADVGWAFRKFIDIAYFGAHGAGPLQSVDGKIVFA